MVKISYYRNKEQYVNYIMKNILVNEILFSYFYREKIINSFNIVKLPYAEP